MKDSAVNIHRMVSAGFAQTSGPHHASVITGLTTGFHLSGKERGRQDSRLLSLLSELKPQLLISVGMNYW